MAAGRVQGFGFCEFEDADSVVRALQHLAGLDVDGQALLVKCNAATQTYIEEYKARKVPLPPPASLQQRAGFMRTVFIANCYCDHRVAADLMGIMQSRLLSAWLC